MPNPSNNVNNNNPNNPNNVNNNPTTNAAPTSTALLSRAEVAHILATTTAETGCKMKTVSLVAQSSRAESVKLLEPVNGESEFYHEYYGDDRPFSIAQISARVPNGAL